MWHVSALYRPCIGHRTGYSLHENARISGLASADFEGVFAHSYKRWRPRLFLRALRKEPIHFTVDEATVVPPASKSECPSWLRPVPKTERRIDGGPPVAKSSAETEAQRQRVKPALPNCAKHSLRHQKDLMVPAIEAPPLDRRDTRIFGRIGTTRFLATMRP
jgi:hypothetical protein